MLKRFGFENSALWILIAANIRTSSPAPLGSKPIEEARRRVLDTVKDQKRHEVALRDQQDLQARRSNVVQRASRTSGLTPAVLRATPGRPAPVPTRSFHVTSRPTTGASPSALGARPRARAVRLAPTALLGSPSP